MTCDAIRDRLPELATGALRTGDADRLEAHLAVCGECEAELELLHLLRRHPVTAPAGLRTRVREAVVGPEPRVIPFPQSSKRRREWRGAARAASVAAAVLAGSVWFLWARAPATSLALDDTDVDLAAVLEPFSGWPRSDVHLAGAVVLEHLTDEELEFVLMELEW